MSRSGLNELLEQQMSQGTICCSDCIVCLSDEDATIEDIGLLVYHYRKTVRSLCKRNSEGGGEIVQHCDKVGARVS